MKSKFRTKISCCGIKSSVIQRVKSCLRRLLSCPFSYQTLENNNTSEELRVQLKVFYEHRDDDFEEFAGRFDNIRLELEDPNECFELIKNMVIDTPSEPYFLSILQHLLCIRDDVQIR